VCPLESWEGYYLKYNGNNLTLNKTRHFSLKENSMTIDHCIRVLYLEYLPCKWVIAMVMQQNIQQFCKAVFGTPNQDT